MKAIRTGMLGAALLLIPSDAVLADQIDGNWCHTSGKRLSIEGPRIVTPGGTKMTGDYDRHGFSYIVPPGEAGAGKNMVTSQQDDETMHMAEGELRARPEIAETWHRCGPPVS